MALSQSMKRLSRYLFLITDHFPHCGYIVVDNLCRILIADKIHFRQQVFCIVKYSVDVKISHVSDEWMMSHNHDTIGQPSSPEAASIYHDFQNNGFPVKYWRRSRFIFFSFILRFWNQIFTCRSVRLSILDNCRRFSLFMYTLKKNSRSSSRI